MEKINMQINCPPDIRGMSQYDLGSWGEIATSEYLQSLGHFIIDVNWHAGRLGEVDIISKLGDVFHFTEVKTRRGNHSGNPYEAVTLAKIRKLRVIITIWLKNHGQVYSYKTVSNNIASICVNKDIVEATFMKGVSLELD
jgi:putative endonuclease